MHLVMLGPPAAGKGTQGKLLSSRYGIPHISTGSMFRASMHTENDLGQQVRQCMERGELVPDELAIIVVKERLRQPDCQQGFVLDGFPRTVPQANGLDSVLKRLGMELDTAISVVISEAESINRIANRRVCNQCGATSQVEMPGMVCQECGGPLVQRPDDTPDTARNRLVVYLAQTEPVIAYYRNCGHLIAVDGERPVEQVFSDITRQLNLVGASTQNTVAGNEVAE